MSACQKFIGQVTGRCLSLIHTHSRTLMQASLSTSVCVCVCVGVRARLLTLLLSYNSHYFCYYSHILLSTWLSFRFFFSLLSSVRACTPVIVAYFARNVSLAVALALCFKQLALSPLTSILCSRSHCRALSLTPL